MKSLFEYYRIFERKFSKEQRMELADKGMALPDGSFPIENEQDLKNAIRAYGRAKDKDRAKAWVIKRAKEMGKVNLLPDSWNVSEAHVDPRVEKAYKSYIKAKKDSDDDIDFADDPSAALRTYNKILNRVYSTRSDRNEIEKILKDKYLNEGKIKFKEEYPVYHDTYGSALDAIMRYVESSGNTIEQQEFFSSFGDAFFKPRKGKTQKETLEIKDKNGNLIGYLHVQIYNRGTNGNTYELNIYHDEVNRKIRESLHEGKKYAKPPKRKEKIQEDEAPNYPQELDDVIDDLELEIESYFDDHDELMTSVLHDYIIEAIKEKLKEESFDDWDKNYNHEVIRDVLDNVKENKDIIIELALENLFSDESRILDEVREDLEAAKDKQKEYETQRAEDKAARQTGTDFDLSEEEEAEYNDDDDEDDDDEGTVILKSVETLESQLTKEYYTREYKKLFDKHFKTVSGKIKKITR